MILEFKVISIAILTVFYGCYIIKMLHQKKQGIQTDQMGKGKLGFAKFIEIALKIAAFLVVAVEVVSIFLGTSRGSVSFRIMGAILSIVGTTVFIISVLTMRDSWRAGVSASEKTELVTGGIYQISRNPAFWALTSCILAYY